MPPGSRCAPQAARSKMRLRARASMWSTRARRRSSKASSSPPTSCGWPTDGSARSRSARHPLKIFRPPADNPYGRRPTSIREDSLMDSTACRERLAHLIAEEAAALEELETLLAREHASLTANDVPALDETIRQRQRCAARALPGARSAGRRVGARADPALVRPPGHAGGRLEAVLRGGGALPGAQ